jgi:DNA repair protein RecO (recombination protein O)
MEWQDQGILLSVRRHGEGAAIIDVLTETHGRHTGLVRGGGSRKAAAMLQPGNQLALTWRARLEDQLGSFTVELVQARSAVLLSTRLKLYGFNALSSMLIKYLPEREPNIDLFDACLDLLGRIQKNEFWLHRYCLFELEMLETIGYGLDLSECAVTGETSDLTHVSPKTGRAVSRKTAAGWEDRLLTLPKFLANHELADVTAADFRSALRLSGHFFENFVPISRAALPEARNRLFEVV